MIGAFVGKLGNQMLGSLGWRPAGSQLLGPSPLKFAQYVRELQEENRKVQVKQPRREEDQSLSPSYEDYYQAGDSPLHRCL